MRAVGKLGRLPHDPVLYAKLPAIGKHMDALLDAEPPPSPDWTRNVASGTLGMCLNDKYGDCTCAAVAHALTVWESYCPPLSFMPDDDVLTLYERVCPGFDPATDSNDNGAVIADVLKAWISGVQCAGAVDKLTAFHTIDPTNHNHIRAAIWAFGVLDVGIVLRQSDDDDFDQGNIWVKSTGPILGGHCVIAAAADDNGVKLGTWGQWQDATWAWWDEAVEECYTLLSPRWISAGNTPSSLSVAMLEQDMQSLA